MNMNSDMSKIIFIFQLIFEAHTGGHMYSGSETMTSVTLDDIKTRHTSCPHSPIYNFDLHSPVTIDTGKKSSKKID